MDSPRHMRKKLDSSRMVLESYNVTSSLFFKNKT